MVAKCKVEVRETGGQLIMDIPKTLATFGTRHKTKQNTHNTENVKGKQLTPAMLLIVYIYIEKILT